MVERSPSWSELPRGIAAMRRYTGLVLCPCLPTTVFLRISGIYFGSLFIPRGCAVQFPMNAASGGCQGVHVRASHSNTRSCLWDVRWKAMSLVACSTRFLWSGTVFSCSLVSFLLHFVLACLGLPAASYVCVDLTFCQTFSLISGLLKLTLTSFTLFRFGVNLSCDVRALCVRASQLRPRHLA